MRVRRQGLQAGCVVLWVIGSVVVAGAKVTQSGKAVAAKSTRSAATSRSLVAATPPMGWNSWNFFAGKVTDKDIRDTADLLVSTGMRAMYM